MDRNEADFPPGYYRLDKDNEFERIDDAGELRRYHATSLPEGEFIKEFVPSMGSQYSRNRPSLGNIPAVYTSSDASAVRLRGYALQGGEEGQLYTVRIKPDRVLDIGDCQDDDVANRAIRAGFDVIECPDFWEQSETIVLDPSKIEVEKIHLTSEAHAIPRDYEWEEEDDEQINKLKDRGMVVGPVYEHGEFTGFVPPIKPESTGNSKFADYKSTRSNTNPYITESRNERVQYVRSLANNDPEMTLDTIQDAVAAYKRKQNIEQIASRGEKRSDGYRGVRHNEGYKSNRGRGHLRMTINAQIENSVAFGLWR